MNVFNKKPESRHSDENIAPLPGAVLRMPERSPQQEPARSASPLSPAAPPARDGAASRPAKASLISEGFEYTGDMKSEGSLTVEGTIKGNLVLKTLTIGATGLVDGSVKAESINVEGNLYGVIQCADLVVGNHAIVDGKLNYSSITIQRGGTIKGELKRT